VVSKPKRSPEMRRRYFTTLSACAQLTLFLGVAMSRLTIPDLDFVIGVLYGFSMAGNLALLVMVVRNQNGGRHD
jgi:hypothetical protein